MKNNKKSKKIIVNDEILEFSEALWGLSRGFVTPFRATFIFGASQSELSNKSYGRLKFFHPKFLKP